MSVHILPTRNRIDAAWERYAELARAVIDEPALMLDRGHSETLAVAWADWRDLFLAANRRARG